MLLKTLFGCSEAAVAFTEHGLSPFKQSRGGHNLASISDTQVDEKDGATKHNIKS